MVFFRLMFWGGRRWLKFCRALVWKFRQVVLKSQRGFFDGYWFELQVQEFRDTQLNFLALRQVLKIWVINLERFFRGALCLSPDWLKGDYMKLSFRYCLKSSTDKGWRKARSSLTRSSKKMSNILKGISTMRKLLVSDRQVSMLMQGEEKPCGNISTRRARKNPR